MKSHGFLFSLWPLQFPSSFYKSILLPLLCGWGLACGLPRWQPPGCSSLLIMSKPMLAREMSCCLFVSAPFNNPFQLLLGVHINFIPYWIFLPSRINKLYFTVKSYFMVKSIRQKTHQGWKGKGLRNTNYYDKINKQNGYTIQQRRKWLLFYNKFK